MTKLTIDRNDNGTEFIIYYKGEEFPFELPKNRTAYDLLFWIGELTRSDWLTNEDIGEIIRAMDGVTGFQADLCQVSRPRNYALLKPATLRKRDPEEVEREHRRLRWDEARLLAVLLTLERKRHVLDEERARSAARTGS